MILRDSVQAIPRDGGSALATIRAQVGYRTVTLDVNPAGGGGFQVEQKLTALTDVWEWDMETHAVRFRDEDYTITGILWRRRNGMDHHVSLDLERITG